MKQIKQIKQIKEGNEISFSFEKEMNGACKVSMIDALKTWKSNQQTEIDN